MEPERFMGSEFNQLAKSIENNIKNMESERPTLSEVPFLESDDFEIGEVKNFRIEQTPEWTTEDSERESVELPQIEKPTDVQDIKLDKSTVRMENISSDRGKTSDVALNSEKKQDLTYEEKVKKQEKEISDVESGEKDFDRNNTHETGNYGEMKTDQDLRSKGYERLSNDMVTDIDENGHQGIDGVYYNPDGNPQYIIVDSKYGSAQLNPDTKDGKQMSENWIDKRLDKDVGKEKADDIRMEKLLNPDNVGSYVAHVDKEGNVTYDKLDGDANVIEKDVKINE